MFAVKEKQRGLKSAEIARVMRAFKNSAYLNWREMPSNKKKELALIALCVDIKRERNKSAAGGNNKVENTNIEEYNSIKTELNQIENINDRINYLLMKTRTLLSGTNVEKNQPLLGSFIEAYDDIDPDWTGRVVEDFGIRKSRLIQLKFTNG